MMINKLLFFSSLLVIGLSSCSSESCEDNLPAFEENLIGTWTYSDLSGEVGEITFNADGTYEEASGEIISNGAITSRMWSIEGQGVKFDVGNAGATLSYTGYDCDSISFTAFGFPITFTRK